MTDGQDRKTVPSLSPELLHLIFRNLRLSADWTSQDRGEENRLRLSTLKNVCLSSRKLHALATEHLYHTIEYNALTDDHKFVRLLNLLCEHPTRGSLVQLLDIGTIECEGNDLCSQIHEPLSVQMRDRINVSDLDFLGESSNDDSKLTCARVVMMVLLCPDLRGLTIRIQYEFGHSIAMTLEVPVGEDRPGMLSAFSKAWTIASRLSAVHLCIDYREERMPIAVATGFLKLPSIRSLTLEHAVCDRFPTDNDFRSLVEHISLKRSNVDAHGLEQLLVRCPVLRTLSIEFHWQLGSSSNVTGFDWSALGNVLQSHGCKLEDLTISAHRPPRTVTSDDQYFRTEETLGHLTLMTSLKHLRVYYNAIFDDDPEVMPDQQGRLTMTLPISLETLDIVQYYETAVSIQLLGERLCSLMTCDRFERLRKITFGQQRKVFTRSVLKAIPDDYDNDYYRYVLAWT